jgi:hypothetical protein
VLIELDEALGRNEPDPEIRQLILASVGLNLGMDFLPGSITFDPAAGGAAEPEIASTAVWFDALQQRRAIIAYRFVSLTVPGDVKVREPPP